MAHHRDTIAPATAARYPLQDNAMCFLIRDLYMTRHLPNSLQGAQLDLYFHCTCFQSTLQEMASGSAAGSH